MPIHRQTSDPKPKKDKKETEGKPSAKAKGKGKENSEVGLKSIKIYPCAECTLRILSRRRSLDSRRWLSLVVYERCGMSLLRSVLASLFNFRFRKKEFANIEKPSKQVARIKEILSELGMTGRLSMEKAKAIREKRELAAW